MPITVIARYVAKAGRESEVEALLAKHWRTLHGLALATDRPAAVYRGLPDAEAGESVDDTRTYVEIFEWVDEAAVGTAHETPEVLALWEPLTAACERFEFPHFQPL